MKRKPKNQKDRIAALARSEEKENRRMRRFERWFQRETPRAANPRRI